MMNTVAHLNWLMHKLKKNTADTEAKQTSLHQAGLKQFCN